MNPFIGLAEDLRGQDWRDDALCAQMDPALFFPGTGESGSEAKKVCQMCPVIAECRQFALDRKEPYGVWGGMTESERRQNRRTRPPTPSPRCGTASGANRHYRRNEQVCLRCRQAAREENRRRRDTGGAA